MRAAVILSIVLSACGPSLPAPQSPSPPAAQAGPEWDSMRGLLGSWEGTDPAHGSTGQFSLTPILGGKVLERRNVNESPQGRHEDLMLIFHIPTGIRAAYFDNEGHIIQYAVTAANNHIELLSDEMAGAPRFKLTYDLAGNDLTIDFAIAPPGSTEFKHYTGGVVHRAAQPINAR
jgi:hypothetical protein